MAEIRIEHVVKTYDDVVAVNDFSLTINNHEFVVLLGPSGCGKTTLLRAVAGLGDIDSGRILIDEQDVTHLPPKDRGLSMIFQSYALYPHMNVYDNIAFSLKMKRLSKQEIAERVQEAAALLHIEEVLNRQPATLSGGQRQRVAIARAIAGQARGLLMDEPLSNLDPVLRMEMRVQLKRLLRIVPTTTLYVTHDQTEALNMGDRIAVMNEGQLIQFDAPTTLYDLPATRFVAGFIGHPPMNFLAGQVRRRNGTLYVTIGQFVVEPIPLLVETLQDYDGKPIIIGIRAENITVLSEPADNALRATVTAIEELGARHLLTIPIGDDVIKVSTQPTFPARVNDNVWLRFPPEKIRWIDRDTGRTLIPDLEQLTAEQPPR